MTFIDDFRESLNQIILIHAYKGNDGYQDTYEEGRSCPCRFYNVSSKIIKSDSTVAISTTQIHLDGAIEVSERDKVTLEDGSNPMILKVQKVPELDSKGCYKIIIFT